MGVPDHERGWRGASAVTRVAVMVAVGGLVTVVAGTSGRWVLAPLLGWITAALVFVIWAWLAITPMDGEQTRIHATREDPSRSTTDILITFANVASLGAV